MKNTPKEPKSKVRVKKKDGGENSLDYSIETMFLMIKSGRLFIQTTNQEEALDQSFGRLWKPITAENKTIVSMCGMVKPSDGLYKIIDKKVVKLLP